MQSKGHHDFTVADPVYESDARPAPDSEFLAGELALAVAGNRGRLRDARRMPVSLTAVDPARCEIEVRIDAFEDRGVRWRLPAWEITRLQLRPLAGAPRRRPRQDCDMRSIGSNVPW